MLSYAGLISREENLALPFDSFFIKTSISQRKISWNLKVHNKDAVVWQFFFQKPVYFFSNFRWSLQCFCTIRHFFFQKHQFHREKSSEISKFIRRVLSFDNFTFQKSIYYFQIQMEFAMLAMDTMVRLMDSLFVLLVMLFCMPTIWI